MYFESRISNLNPISVHEWMPMLLLKPGKRSDHLSIFSVSAQQVKTQSKLCNGKKVPWPTLNDRIDLINFHYSLLQKTYKQNPWRPASESPCSCRRAFSVPDRKKTCYQTDYTDYQYKAVQGGSAEWKILWRRLHIYIYTYIFNFAQRVGSKHLQSNPLPHLVVLHQPYAGGYTSGGWLEQPNMLGNNKHYSLFPFGILKEQMILFCHSTGGTTLEDVNECHDCHAAEFHPTLFWHPRTKQLKLHFLDTYSTASTKPSFLSWQQTVTRGVWVSSQRILSCPHTPHLMPKFSSSTSAASSA